MQRTDFSSHRVLVLGSKTHALLLLRSILGTVGITQFVQVADPRRALELLSTEIFHAVFYDPRCELPGGVAFPIAARRKDSMLNPLVPIFALQERARRRDVEHARDAGVTDVITIPISPRTVITKLKAAPRPFIVAQEFFGPDRRARDQGILAAGERRVRTARKHKVDFTHI